MAISAVIASGMQGIQYGINKTDGAAGRIAIGTSNDTAEMSSALVGLRIGEIQVKAAADVVKTGDAMLGTLINIRA